MKLRSVAVAVASFAVIAACAVPTTALAITSGHRAVYAQSGAFTLGGVSNNLAACLQWTRQNPGSLPSSSKVFCVDVSNGSTLAVSTDAGMDSAPSISGHRVVWTNHQTGGPTTLVLYDLFTATKSVIVTANVTYDEPQVDGDDVVWTQLDGGVLSIHGVDLSSGTTFTVAGAVGEDGDYPEPSVAGGWVVYTDQSAGGYKANIRAYQIATGTTYRLSPSAGTLSGAKIAPNGLVVWQSQVGLSMNLWLSNVWDRRAQQLTKGKGYYGEPFLNGNVVICHSEDNGEVDGCRIIGFDLLAGTKFGISPTADDLDAFASLDNNGVAWVQDDIAEHRPPSNSYPGVFTLYTAQPAVLGTFSITNPYDASVTQSQQAFPDGADAAVVANASIWDDVVVGAGLAGDDSPLLLTGKDSLPSDVAAELTRLAPKRVEVVGGTSSVSDAVLAQIAAACTTDTVVERTGGANPVDTSLDALATGQTPAALGLTSTGAFSGTVVVVPTGGKVLSGLVVPALRGHNIPVVFANKRFSAGDLSRLKSAGVTRAIVVGGTKDVSALAARQLVRLLGKRNVVRIAGKGVYQTSARLAEYAIRHLGMKLDGVGIATNVATTDVLMAGLKNGSAHSLLLYTGTTKLAAPVAGELKARRHSIHSALYVGRGKRLVGKPVRKAVRLIVH